MSLISLQNVSYRYSSTDDFLALNNISLTIEKGEWITLIGANGSGKSTLVKTLNGLNMPQEGTISVDGLAMNEENIWTIRQKVGMVFQNPDNQFVGSTVADDVAFGLENIGIPRDEMIDRINRSLEQVGMEDFKQAEPARLSGGQKQRVAIAGILALEPEIIILDEATSMLDPKGRAEVLETVKAVKEKSNLTVLSITHDINEAAHADRIFVLEKGQIKYIDVPEEIFKLGDELIDLGLTVPFVEQLKYQLMENGLDLPEEFMTEERLVEWLWKYDSKM
ncbi:energy-coupling factor transport system ATP-binding protein [Atopostipes suicloacalis DSM 15692]|uniref:Energy-coupling factor transport system ATP-binding protein n=1 Tax=Atopostipes suicloacalis DSM 15692 TaxID=1121025 RepID=A0A1M4W3S6_9LACT|nr:energy-coupling factor ABC transporter ATP-binding protein [Atopostipes suicloacalis]SHE75859.1 energy-coupling factor transport system ATP-binding protein [Atopostipes suicloacalis DSM 15692]